MSSLSLNIPMLWRSSDIIFLPKPGKEDYTDRRAFRPISLMPFLFKTLEQLSKWHLEQHATPLHKDQHAFRKGHCTKNALSHMIVWKEDLRRKMSSLLSFSTLREPLTTFLQMSLPTACAHMMWMMISLIGWMDTLTTDTVE
jgi:hypothetical protein